MQSITISLPEGRNYQALVGHDILPEIGTRCRDLNLGMRVAAVVDPVLTQCIYPGIFNSLRAANFDVEEILFPGGDSAKNLDSAEEIIGRLIDFRMDRGCWIMAIGGGVVGDLAGFVAATFLRGVSFVQVPTTIVAQVDASIGGKTAVNHRLGKNTIGVFHQPSLVLTDTAVLRTLPIRDRVSGMSEVVKHAVIRDKKLFEFLELEIDKIRTMEIEPEQLNWLIARNVSIKASVVAADEKESGFRAILNYGHTIGHAIESATNYRGYNHGEAVILGMIAAGRLASLLGIWPVEDQMRQDALLERLGVPAGISNVSAATILERTYADKKRIGGKLRFVLSNCIGDAQLVDDVDDVTVLECIEYIRSKYP